MEVGLIGVHGVIVLLHVVMEHKVEIDHAQIPNHSMEVILVKEKAMEHRLVILGHVQLMEIGLHGVHGVIVLRHVVMENKIEIDHAQIPNHSMEVNFVKEKAMEHRLAILGPVQWMVDGLNGVIGMNALNHVEMELQKEYEVALIQNHKMEDNIVMERIFNIMFVPPIHVQLMVAGQNGKVGHRAQKLVVKV